MLGRERVQFVQELPAEEVTSGIFSKLEVVSDSYNQIVGRLKGKGNSLITFIDSLKTLGEGETNGVNLCMSFIPAPRLLKLTLTAHPKFSSKLNKYMPELRTHSNAFKLYLWENNCIDVSER